MTIEKTFLDRVPKYPGRVVLIPVEGLPNTYYMVRADEPMTEGTPLDKAAFDSIVKSRLTGRYYELTATKVTLSSANGTSNPIPTSWNNATSTGADSGGYSILASGSNGSYHPNRAFDGSTSTYWLSNSNTASWLQINVPESLIVKKMKIAFKQEESWAVNTTLQGRQANGSWIDLATIRQGSDASLVQHTISNPSTYTAYRLNFSLSRSEPVTVYEWQISDWETATYRYDYKIAEGVPTAWTRGQRITVLVPDVSTVGITSNTFNGITVNTILQPNKRYELVYNGTAFTAKEV